VNYIAVTAVARDLHSFLPLRIISLAGAAKQRVIAMKTQAAISSLISKKIDSAALIASIERMANVYYSLLL